jgi:sarcosine oxidase subunit alpha
VKQEQLFRNPSGGLIDRTRPLRFTFNSREYGGYAGDTLASALLANGERLIGRSFKYHRPRGVFGIGAEEPNALVQLGSGARTEPNTKATQTELYDGLMAASQNCWPSVALDLGALAGCASPLLPAGFYYKTFMWPRGWWMAYERLIRRMAGMGKSAGLPDPDTYGHRHAHCDVLVVGGGPAGLAAALVAGRSGARLILVDEGSRLGGTLLGSREQVGQHSADAWIAETEAKLATYPETLVLRRATAFGYYDHNQIGVIERVADHRLPRPGEPRQRLWHIHARQVVLATGAHERPLIFGNNDLPGVMLASAARGYVNRFAVRPGSAAVIVTNNDSAYSTALDLASNGVTVRAVIDTRSPPPQSAAALVSAAGIEHLPGTAILYASGGRSLTEITVAPIDEGGATTGARRRIECDLLGVSGGWTPAVHLHAQARGRPEFDPAISAFRPGNSVQAERSAGAARGTFGLSRCLAEGAEAGAAAASDTGFHASADIGIDLSMKEDEPTGATTLGIMPRSTRRLKRFIDLQNDVTDADIALAVREGYRAVEHVKRYTTLGMGTDQGKTSNVAGFAHVALALETEVAKVGSTTYRPPYVPVALGALAGMEGGRHFMPNRRTPMHDWHVAAGAVMLQSGPWLRPQCYPRPGESLEEAARREARAVRDAVGIVDVSTLGKFELFGPDAAEFLERVYINRWHNLRVGQSRYGVMLRDDGIVLDDGTTTRLDEQHYFMTTTTAQAPLVARRLDYWHRVVWPSLNLEIVPVTDQWAAIALAGPRSREVLARLAEGVDVSSVGLPFMRAASGVIGGAQVRIFRISFSGDLAYEIYISADFGAMVWKCLMEVGGEFGITPYGVDALNALRIEKGHVAGAEIDGRATPDDLGLGRLMKQQGDFIGRRSLSRPGLNEPSRWQLVGLVPEDRITPIPQGAKFVTQEPNRYIGELTSTAWSPSLQMPIGLGLVSAGRSRMGERLIAMAPLFNRRVPVIVSNPVFFDPEGKRLHA